MKQSKNTKQGKNEVFMEDKMNGPYIPPVVKQTKEFTTDFNIFIETEEKHSEIPQDHIDAMDEDLEFKPIKPVDNKNNKNNGKIEKEILSKIKKK